MSRDKPRAMGKIGSPTSTLHPYAGLGDRATTIWGPYAKHGRHAKPMDILPISSAKPTLPKLKFLEPKDWEKE